MLDTGTKCAGTQLWSQHSGRSWVQGQPSCIVSSVAGHPELYKETFFFLFLFVCEYMSHVCSTLGCQKRVSDLPGVRVTGG